MKVLEVFGTAVRRLRGRPRQAVQTVVPSLKLGTDYGGYSVCSTGLGKGSVVYSFGIGEDVSFDLAMIERFGSTVHAFDPTPRSIAWVRAQSLPREFVFHEYGLAAFDGTARFSPPENPAHVSHSLLERKSSGELLEMPVRRLDTILRELGHSELDILKMDIEGAEYDVIEDIVSGSARPRQILLEFHHQLPTVSLARTEQAIDLLNQAGYEIFAISASGREFSFIRGAR